MAKIKVTLEISIEPLVNGSKEDYIKSITDAASKKYDHLNRVYGKIKLGDE